MISGPEAVYPSGDKWQLVLNAIVICHIPYTGGGRSCAQIWPPAVFKLSCVAPGDFYMVLCRPRRFFCVLVPHSHETATVLCRPRRFFKTAGGRIQAQGISKTAGGAQGISKPIVWKRVRTHLITTFYNRHQIYMYYEKYISYPNSSYYIKF